MSSIYLCTPGPTRIPDRIRDVMAKPMIHHRSPEFEKVFSEVRMGINTLLNNDGETMLLSSSGSGGMEASVASLLSPSDHVIVIESGKFGERWVELAKRYQLSADVIKVPWGKAVEVSEIQELLTPNTKAVLTQACETSTGVFHPISEIGALLQTMPDCLFIVDAITALGIHLIDMQKDGIDVVIGGSQKALMCPPGVATVSLRQKAIARLKESQTMYLSLLKEIKSQRKNTSSFTPAVSIIMGLSEALKMIFEEGVAKVYQRHQQLSAHTRHVFSSLGLPIFTEEKDAAFGITVVGDDLSWDVDGWISSLKKEYGLWIAGGQEHLKGKIFRYAHMGYVDQSFVDETLSIIVKSLQKHIQTPSYEEIIRR
ncbi:MAG: alanine--glyoxylate aminotransferase family protein [Bdellovibrionales bacterium]|nr:alanine--glyoxylate aminotransferase family protein [Bdellovibrionales bacterium]